MAKKDLKQYYSCKRKPDVVTWVAIGLFLVMILFQVYLIAFLPMRLQSDETLTYNVTRDKMLQSIDKLNSAMRKTKMQNELAEGERQMVQSAFDRLTLYTREHREGFIGICVFRVFKADFYFIFVERYFFYQDFN